ncbi:MAG: PAS-domain containing protein [Rhodobacterales bacterium]|nr:PAS-domain containing protein [Rhodobacterales bacterium]MDX5391163.1 PAS-domain containing protein [Rhodobacterales bacterium]MDX5490856.1 PAS-domain containing protein [Rhodobacterales bacterium]
MALLNLFQSILPVSLGLLFGGLILVLLAWLDEVGSKKGIQSTPPESGGEGADAAFLFEGRMLLQASERGIQLLQLPQTDGSAIRAKGVDDWGHAICVLKPRFPDIPDDPSEFKSSSGESGRIKIDSIPGTADAAHLVVEWWDDWVRLQIVDHGRNQENATPATDMSEEAGWLRLAVTGAPYPIWQTARDGRVLWANTAYTDLVTRFERRSSDDMQQKQGFPIVFDVPLQTNCDQTSYRLSIVPSGSVQPYWFDVRSLQIPSGWMNYATDVNAVVNAEIAQRNFVQTLTKTFAQLSIGLAIFDRQRQLALFNPALIDLTSLPAEFLSARPNLLSFFDRLRDRQMMPEPKNYRSWRDQIADLVAAADNGLYLETWSLPSGLTYRISGRPHPDGAVAFLFEDISAEISLTRQFRSQLELGQSALNAIEQSIAVFSATGVLAFSNTAYRKMWHIDPDSSFAEITVIDASRHWQSHSLPTPVWGDLRDFVNQFGDRSDWQAEVTLRDGQMVACHVAPMPGGATMVQFMPFETCVSSNTRELMPSAT